MKTSIRTIANINPPPSAICNEIVGDMLERLRQDLFGELTSKMHIIIRSHVITVTLAKVYESSTGDK